MIRHIFVPTYFSLNSYWKWVCTYAEITHKTDYQTDQKLICHHFYITTVLKTSLAYEEKLLA